MSMLVLWADVNCGDSDWHVDHPGNGLGCNDPYRADLHFAALGYEGVRQVSIDASATSSGLHWIHLNPCIVME
jgi:hypothetical protein